MQLGDNDTFGTINHKSTVISHQGYFTKIDFLFFYIAYGLGAYPAGALSDHFGTSRLLFLGAATLIAADLALAFSSGLVGIFVGIALWGLHMALTQGLFAKLVARHAPKALHGSAFGLFNLVTGLALLFASVVAGLLWDYVGPAATFLAGAGIATVAGLMLLGRLRSAD